jgi:recombination DNA repair RAD52 pathway protein
MTHTPLTDKQLKQLTNPIHKDRVAVKQGMSYVEAYDIKATLIRMFGFAGFSSEVTEAMIIKAVEVPQVNNNAKMNWAVTAQATVKLTIHQTGAVYTETAIAGSKQPDFTESADMAIKSAESDALKRAAIFLGTQFGLSLYNSGSMADVVKVVLAPDQVWPPAAPQQETPQERPASAAASVAHLRPEGVDDAKHQLDKANLNSALSAQVKKQAERSGPDVPLYADESLEPAMAGDRDE